MLFVFPFICQMYFWTEVGIAKKHAHVASSFASNWESGKILLAEKAQWIHWCRRILVGCRFLLGFRVHAVISPSDQLIISIENKDLAMMTTVNTAQFDR